MNRREFLDVLLKASVTAGIGGCAPLASSPEAFYRYDTASDARLLHITDTHAQLNPIYFREPNINLGLGSARGQWPHLVGNNLLRAFPTSDSRLRHALTYLDFSEAAERYGKVGGFAHLKTLLDGLRAGANGRALLLDGGDTWQGSGTALWTRGQDMIAACNLLGVDVMTGHWEFTYLQDEVRQNVEAFAGEFVAQNVKATEDALFEGVEVWDEDTGHAFKPYVIERVGDHRIAVVGQAFPYTPIANPRRFIPDWTFGIQEADLKELVAEIRSVEKPSAVVLLSHNGMDVDLKLASRVPGIDFILGGHTHDGVPVPVAVENSGGTTIVTNAGSNGKFVGVLDLNFGRDGIADYTYRLMPVFANLLDPDPQMLSLIGQIREPHESQLSEVLAETESVLYRRGNFNGSFDQVICDAMIEQLDAQIALSPGFRWGTSLLPGQQITMEHVLDQTAMTYPETYVRSMTGEEISFILESVCDNLFNADPYLQQGGDMVRMAGMNYTCAPNAKMGNRIRELRLDDGAPLEASRTYRVAGWATVGAKSPGAPIWDVVADHLRAHGTIRIDRLNEPRLIGVEQNPGYEKL